MTGSIDLAVAQDFSIQFVQSDGIQSRSNFQVCPPPAAYAQRLTEARTPGCVKARVAIVGLWQGDWTR